MAIYRFEAQGSLSWFSICLEPCALRLKGSNSYGSFLEICRAPVLDALTLSEE
jgi:hypothetical protein